MADKLSLGAQDFLAWRLKRKMTQHGVAKLLDVTTNYVSLYENGHSVPNTRTLAEIEDVMGIDYRRWLKPPKSDTEAA